MPGPPQFLNADDVIGRFREVVREAALALGVLGGERPWERPQVHREQIEHHDVHQSNAWATEKKLRGPKQAV
jgi:alpha-L-fucosidase